MVEQPEGFTSLAMIVQRSSPGWARTRSKPPSGRGERIAATRPSECKGSVSTPPSGDCRPGLEAQTSWRGPRPEFEWRGIDESCPGVGEGSDGQAFTAAIPRLRPRLARKRETDSGGQEHKGNRQQRPGGRTQP